MHQELDQAENTTNEAKKAKADYCQKLQQLKEEREEIRKKLNDELKAEQAEARRKFNEELEQKRKALAMELEAKRTNMEEEMLKRVKLYSDSYNHYLSQLKLIMNIITKAAVTVGEGFLRDQDNSIDEMFQAEIGSSLIDSNILNPEERKDTTTA